MIVSPENWPQLSALLDTALELPEDQRLVWIDNLVAESPEIKASLRTLLMAATNADDLMRKPPDFATALLEETQRFQQSGIELQPDGVIGPYRLLRELGQGGMGTVWLAQRIDGKFRREVALKFPYAGPRQRELTERLIRERDILASLEHPNIARLYDADVTASGQPFLVLEYIDGIAINEYCDQHRLDIRARLKLFQQVLKAVRYAHAHLVIHRDLKPSNILVSADGAVHLLDFGIATSIAEGMSHKTPLTQFGGRVLTPEYASPEQVNGTVLTTASDVYVLGVVLYELLTGTLPYRWQRDRRAQLEEAVANADVIMPSRAAVDDDAAACRNIHSQQLRKALRGELDSLLLKALKKQPDERYASADAFADDIVRYLESKPVLAQPDTEWYRIRKFVRRNRGTVASVTAIMIALITGIATTSWQAHVAKRQRDRAVASAARSEAVSDFLQLMVTDVADANEPITMQQLVARTEDIANRTHGNDANQQAAILEVLGTFYMTFENASKANEAFTRAMQLTAHNADSEQQARLLCLSAVAQGLLGNAELEKRQLERGIAMSSNEPEVQATCLYNRAYLKNEELDNNGMLKDIESAQRLLTQSGINKPEFMADLTAGKAAAYNYLGLTYEADREYTKAIELLNKYGRGDTAAVMNIQNDWAQVHNSDPLHALEHIDKAMEIARKRGKESEGNFIANRAFVLHLLARDEEAIAGYRQAISIAEKNGAVTTVAYDKQRLALVLLLLNRIDEAKQLAKEVLPLTNKKIAGEAALKQGAITFNGELAMKLQHYDEAIQYFTENINFLVERNMRGGYLSNRLIKRGQAYLASKDFASALSDATQAYDLARSVQANLQYSMFSGNSALLLAKIHDGKKENEEAHKWAAIAFRQLQGSLGDTHPATVEAKELLDTLSAPH